MFIIKMRSVFLALPFVVAVLLNTSCAHANDFLTLPITFDGASYTVGIDFYNLTSQFTMGSRNFSVSLIPLFGADYVAVADDTCEDCEIKGFNATESREDGFLANSTKNGLAKEV